MNAEIAELTQTGKTKYYHHSRTHDDRLWALALAVYGSRHETPRYHPFAALGRNHLAWLAPNLPRSLPFEQTILAYAYLDANWPPLIRGGRSDRFS